MSDSQDNQGGLPEWDGILNNAYSKPASYPPKMSSTHSHCGTPSGFTKLSFY